MSAAFETRPLSDLLGAEVIGADLSGGGDDRQRAAIARLVYRYGVVCFRDQCLSPDELAAFGRSLGRPVVHREENLLFPGLPEVMVLSNADDRDQRQLNGGAHWHTDLVHTEEPASFTMLSAVAVPAAGGATLFASQAAAYAALPASRRRRIEDLVVIHCYEGRTDGSVPLVQHPLVQRHPATGTPVLYGAADTGIGIVGMADRAAGELLADIGRHATAERFVYRHRYALNDLVIWDNAQLLHSAEPLERARTREDRRIMHRVSVRGWPSPGR